MLRRPLILAALLVLAACSDGGNGKCKEGITFYVADVTGAMAPGTSEQLKICFDGSCKEVKVSRAESGPTVFLEFGGVGKDGDHTITVTGTGSLKGEYRGPLSTFTQKADSGSCALGAVKISSDGTVTPGSAVPTDTVPPTTTAGATATTGG